MRIYVVEPDGAGGMIHYAYQLCTALAANGADVTLVTGHHYELADLPHTFSVDPRMALWPAVGEQEPRSRVVAVAAHIYRKLRRAWRGVRYFTEWARLTRHLVRERPDVVQFAVIRFPFQVIFLRRLRRAGIALTQICHEFEPRERGGLVRWVNRRMSRAVYRSFDRIFLHGEEVRSRFLESFDVDPGRTVVIPHGNEAMFLDLVAAGTPPPTPTDIPADRPIALFFGGLRPSKGIEDLIDAWRLVISELDAHLVVCGQPAGVEIAMLEARIEDLELGDHITLRPGYLPLEEVSGVFGLADLVVLPYRSATASGVLQLAYAFGLPVVATELGALGEDVEDGITGLLVPPRDPESLARAVVKILGDPAEVVRMGGAARVASERFGWDPIAHTIIEQAREVTT